MPYVTGVLSVSCPCAFADRASDLVREVLGVEPAPELLAIAMVYFVQGILGLSRLGTMRMDDISLGLRTNCDVGGSSERGATWRPARGRLICDFARSRQLLFQRRPPPRARGRGPPGWPGRHPVGH